MLKNKKSVQVLLAGSLLTFLLASGIPKKTYALEQTDRIWGNDRYETSINISKSGWTSSQYVILATALDFPDALCAAPLAKKYNAPILLISKDKLSDSVKSELSRLGVSQAFIIGGTGVISAQVENDLKAMNITSTRYAGKDRYETAVKVAQNLGSFSEAVIATGSSFPDALSIAPIAAKKGIPILLTDKSDLPQNVIDFAKNKGINKAYIVGGIGVVSDKVLSRFSSSERLGGSDRYATNLAIVNRFSAELNYDNVYMATGEDFPDALSGSALAPITSSPIVLTGKDVNDNTKTFMSKILGTSSVIKLLGGEGAVPSSAAQDILSFKERDSVAANNIVNFSFVATDGVWEYREKKINGQYQLYKIKLDGTQSIKLSNDNPGFINVSGDWVYYINISDMKLYKVKKDGTNRTMILDVNANSVRVVGDWIYYTKTNDGVSNLYKIKTDGTGNTKFTFNDSSIIGVSDFITVSGDWIYTTCYIKDPATSILSSYIYKIKVDDSQSIKISDDYSYRLNVLEDWIYYQAPNDIHNIYKIKVDGTKKTKITNNTADDADIYNFVVTPHGIYYSQTDNDNHTATDKVGLYQINLDGSGNISMSNLKARFINVINNWIYFDDGSADYRIMTDGTNLQDIK